MSSGLITSLLIHGIETCDKMSSLHLRFVPECGRPRKRKEYTKKDRLIDAENRAHAARAGHVRSRKATQQSGKVILRRGIRKQQLSYTFSCKFPGDSQAAVCVSFPAQTPQTVSAVVKQKRWNSTEPGFAKDSNIWASQRTRPVSSPFGNVEGGEATLSRRTTYAEEEFLGEALTAGALLQVKRNFAEEEEKDGELKLANWYDPRVQRVVMRRFHQWEMEMLDTEKAEQQRPPAIHHVPASLPF
jgi:hypothetical protein